MHRIESISRFWILSLMVAATLLLSVCENMLAGDGGVATSVQSRAAVRAQFRAVEATGPLSSKRIRARFAVQRAGTSDSSRVGMPTLFFLPRRRPCWCSANTEKNNVRGRTLSWC